MTCMLFLKLVRHLVGNNDLFINDGKDGGPCGYGTEYFPGKPCLS